MLETHTITDKALFKRLLRELDSTGEPPMLSHYTATYTKISHGYMGQIIEWPEVITEGVDLDDCRAMLADALREMMLAYQEQGREIPASSGILEQIPVEIPACR